METDFEKVHLIHIKYVSSQSLTQLCYSPPLTWWPAHLPAPHDMDMQMLDRLSSFNTIVDDKSAVKIN